MMPTSDQELWGLDVHLLSSYAFLRYHLHAAAAVHAPWIVSTWAEMSPSPPATDHCSTRGTRHLGTIPMVIVLIAPGKAFAPAACAQGAAQATAPHNDASKLIRSTLPCVNATACVCGCLQEHPANKTVAKLLQVGCPEVVYSGVWKILSSSQVGHGCCAQDV
jgi:hypothetical protein